MDTIAYRAVPVTEMRAATIILRYGACSVLLALSNTFTQKHRHTGRWNLTQLGTWQDHLEVASPKGDSVMVTTSVEAPAYRHVLFEQDDLISYVTMNRPERRNALSLAHMEELID